MLAFSGTRWLLGGLAVAALASAMLAATLPERAAAVTDCNLSAPASITVSNTPNQAGAVVNYPPPTTTGSCATVTCSPATGSFYALGTTLVTCAASTNPPVRDRFTIRVVDTQPPQLFVPPGKTVSNDPGTASAVVSFDPPIATDNAPGVTASCDHLSGSLFPLGSTAVTCTARDSSANTAVASFDVVVVDTEAPGTEIDSGPARRTERAKVRFEFDSDDPTATFECRLDKGRFKRCSPNQSYKVGKGKHTIAVRAVDASANADPTPAVMRWRFKPRR